MEAVPDYVAAGPSGTKPRAADRARYSNPSATKVLMYQSPRLHNAVTSHDRHVGPLQPLRL